MALFSWLRTRVALRVAELFDAAAEILAVGEVAGNVASLTCEACDGFGPASVCVVYEFST